MSKHDATRYIDPDLPLSGGPRMRVAHTYAELEARLTRLKEELKFRTHSPSWGYPQIPDGLALCIRCWRLITVLQLGAENCPGAARAVDR